MPRKLAFTGGHQVEVVEYEDRPLAPNEVRIQTEYASGKHGTPLAMMDGRNDRGQRWDEDMRLFIPSEDDDVSLDPGGFPLGTSGVGSIIELGTDVSDWNIGDRVISFLDVSETNTIVAQRQDYWTGPPLWLDGCIWHLGDIDPLLASMLRAGFCLLPLHPRIQRPLCRHRRRHRIGSHRIAGGAYGCVNWRGTDLRRGSAAKTPRIGARLWRALRARSL